MKRFLCVAGFFLFFSSLNYAASPVITATDTVVNETNGWSLVGNSVAGAPADIVTMATLSNGRVVIVGTNGGTPQLESVYAFDGTTWSLLVSQPFFSDHRLPQMAVSSSDTLFVAYQEGLAAAAKIYVYRSTDGGLNWSMLTDGGTNHVGTNTYAATSNKQIGLSVDALDRPYIAFRDTTAGQKATVKRYNGSSWETVGGAGFSNGAASDLTVAIDSNNNPVVAFRDSSSASKVSAMGFDGANWNLIGNAGFSPGAIQIPSIDLDSYNRPYVAYYTGSSSAQVAYFTGSSWQHLADVDSVEQRMKVIVDNDDFPIVSYRGASNLGYSKKWNGNQWLTMGGGPYTHLQAANSPIDINTFQHLGAGGRFYTAFTLGTTSYVNVLGGQIGFEVASGRNEVGTLVATDADNDVLSWGVLGGGDAALFSIDSSSGLLSFKNPADFSAPLDSNVDNIYYVTVQVSDNNSGTDTVTVRVEVIEDSGPVILTGSQDGVLTLDGQNGSSVNIIEDSDLSLSHGNEISIGAWINITDTSNSVILIKTDDRTSRDLSYLLRIFNDQLQMVVGDGFNYAICFAPVITNAWQHVIGTYNGSGTPLIYINGELQACSSPRAATLTSLRATTQGAVIGAHPNAAGQGLNGQLDELALWDNALTGDEISSIYNTGNYVSTLVNNNNNYVSAQNLQGYWRFNEVSGTSAADSSKSNNVGTVTGGFIWATQDLFSVGAIEWQTSVKSYEAFDANGDTISWSISGGDDQVLFDIDSVTGELTFKSGPSFSAPSDHNADNNYLVQIQATANGQSTTLNIEVVVADNVLPVALDDSALVVQSNSVVIDLRSNDSDVETAITDLTITNLSTPNYGTVVDNGDGTVTYTHTGNDQTSDSFTYIINDGSENSAPATVDVTVLEPTFQCDGTVYHSRGPKIFSVNTNTLPFAYNQIGETSKGISSNALGFNYVDGYLYAMGSTRNTQGHLIKIDVNGKFTNLGKVSGLPKKKFAHGTFDINGDYLVSENHRVYVIDVATVSVKETIGLHVQMGVDIAFNSRDGKVYSADERRVRISDLTAKTSKVLRISGMPANAGGFGSHWFDSQGNLYISANTSEDVYRIANPDTAPVATYVGRGVYNGSPFDAASCVGAPALSHTITPNSISASGTVTHTYTIDNGLASGDSTGDPFVTGLNDVLSDGRTFVSGTLAVNGAVVVPNENAYAGTDTLSLSNLQVPANGQVSITIDVSVPTLSAGIYQNQARMTNVPVGLGGNEANEVLSDYPLGFKIPDPTPLEFTGSNNKISGIVFEDYDGDGIQDNNEPGLRGVLVSLDDSTSVLTGIDGSYVFSYLNDGVHKVESSRLSSAWFATSAEVINSNTLTGGQSQTMNFAYNKGNGVIRGNTFYDFNADGSQQEGEELIENVLVTLSDKDGNTVATTLSDNAGFYSFTKLLPGLYWTEVTTPTAHFSVSASLQPTYVVSYKEAHVDFTFIEQSKISGEVYDDTNGDLIISPQEFGLSGVILSLYDENEVLLADTVTNSLGQYSFTGLSAGNYTLIERDPNNYISLSRNTVQLSISNSGSAVVNFADQQVATISGIVFDDTNSNGLQDKSEVGLSNINVSLDNGTNVTTDERGLYKFTGLASADYIVSIPSVGGYLDASNQALTLNPGSVANANFALIRPNSVSGRLFVDENIDGISSVSELGVSGIQIKLSSTGPDIYSYTDDNGYYQFENLAAADYTVTYILPEGYLASLLSQSTTLTSGSMAQLNFPLNYEGVVRGQVFNDINRNVQFDLDEIGIAGVTVNLSGKGDRLTDINGGYIFPFVANGSVTVTQTDLENYSSTSSNTVMLTVSSDTQVANFADRQPNKPPIAVDDSLTLMEDSTGEVIDVLINDNDFDNDTLSITSATVDNGSVIINNNGTLTYIPSPNYFGSATIAYSIADGYGGVDSANVLVIINAFNDAPLISTTVNTSAIEDIPYNYIAGVIDPDDSNDGIELHWALVNAPQGMTVSSTGVVSWLPVNGVITSGLVTLTVADGGEDGALPDSETFTITVTPVNDAPVAADDRYSVNEGGNLSVGLITGVNSNDSDIDSSFFSALVTMPHHGLLVLNPDGSFSYQHNGSEVLIDSFTYLINDGTLESNIATVTITVVSVNDAPIAVDDSLTIKEDNKDNIISVLNNDTDIDGDILTITSAVSASGSVVINSDGTISYTPDPDFYGVDTITYLIDDGNGGASTAIVTVTIIAVNDPPVALDDRAELLEDSIDNIVNVLNNDSDPDSDPLTVTGVSALTGNVSINDDGTLSYTPETNFNGVDTITYTITDEGGLSTTATVIVDVAGINDTPVAVDDSYTAYDWLAKHYDVLANDSDSDNEVLTLLSVSAEIGDASIKSNQLVYTPVQGQLDQVIINYSVVDESNSIAHAKVRISFDIDESELLPDITPPADLCGELVINANALYTKVDLGVASAIDRFGNPLPVSLVDGSPFYPPGVNTAYWQATDAEGNTAIASQKVCVKPLVSIQKDQRIVEGEHIDVTVHLNGNAEQYPLVIPYTVSGSASSFDHNLVAGEIVIEDGSEGRISFESIIDDLNEIDETIVISLDSSLNLGVKHKHTATITSGNIAPEIQLLVGQDNESRMLISKAGGPVIINSTVYDGNANDLLSYDWLAQDQQLINQSSQNTVFEFDPSTVAVGIYFIELTVTDDGADSKSSTASVYVQIVDSLGELTSLDSDGDNIPDNIEGRRDLDGDGISDYLDRIDECNVLIEESEVQDGYLIEGNPGVCLRRGDFSLVATTGGAFITEPDIELPRSQIVQDNEADNVGGIFDFIAYDLPEVSQQIAVTLPQRKPVPANAVYRKYSLSDGWGFFVEDDSNQLWSAKGESGYCPPPLSNTWQPGLVEGSWCVQLIIEDGGPNDDDKLVNQMVVDPGYVGVLVSNNIAPIAKNLDITLPLNGSTVIDLQSLVSDADDDVLTILDATGQYGALELTNSDLSYQTLNGYGGSDSIIYVVSDGKGGIATATITVVILANLKPVVDVPPITIEQGTVAPSINVLDYSSDPENDAIDLHTASAINGNVTFDNAGNLIYTPNAGFVGTDTVSIEVMDSFGNTTQAQFNVIVESHKVIAITKSQGGMFNWLLLALLLLYISWDLSLARGDR